MLTHILLGQHSACFTPFFIMPPGMKTLFLVCGWNLLEHWLWSLCSSISSTHWDGTRLILKNGLSSVLLSWKLHPDSLSAAGKGWLATKVSVCLLLTGSLGLEPRGSVLVPLRTWASRGCNGIGINNVSSYFQLKNI